MQVVTSNRNSEPESAILMCENLTFDGKVGSCRIIKWFLQYIWVSASWIFNHSLWES